MRKIWLPVTARRLGIGLAAAGLLASMAPSTLASAAKPPPARSGPTLARAVTAEATARARAMPTARTAVGAGGISGLVDSIAGDPLANACVTAVGQGTSATARTAPDGRYLLAGLRPGQYRIRVGTCASAMQRPDQTFFSASVTQGMATVTVRARQISTPAPLSLWRLDQRALISAEAQAPQASGARPKTGSISGLVTGHGHPLRGICAVAFSPNGNTLRYTTTTKTGRYRIGRLRPGRYDVVFLNGLLLHCGNNNANWLMQWYPNVNSPFPTRKVKAVRVRTGKDTGGIDGRLKLGGEIAGRVRAGSGKPLGGICVNVFASFQGGSVGIVYTFATDKAGRYAAHGLFPSGYQVQFTVGCGNKSNYAAQWWRGQPSQASASTIRITGTREVTDVNATLLPGATVSGVVKAVNAAGKPLAGVCVTVVDKNGDEDGFAFTGRHGGYLVNGLAAGRYLVQFDPSCIGNGNSPYQFEQRRLTLTVGEKVSGFNAYLPLGGGISGVVTDGHGRPLDGVCVQVLDENGDMTRTRANGRYSLVGIQTGSDLVQFSGGCGSTGSVAPQFYPNQPSSLLAKPVRFRPNTITPNVDATMQPGSTLAGLVTDTAGHRLSRICVDAYSTEPPLPDQGTPVGGATVVDGRYQIPNLAPGAYNLSFGCGGYGEQWFPSQLNPVNASLISVNPGVTTRVAPARLSRAGAITGTVTDAAGKPVDSACILVAPAGNRSTFFPLTGTNPDQHGRYRVGGLAPGRYLVQFTDCSETGALATQWYRRQSAEAAANSVRVLAGRTTAGINGALTEGGSITGLVVGPNGKPANAICVEAFSQSAQTALLSQTGRSGRYRLNGLSTGRWSLFFSPCFSPKPDLAEFTRPGTVQVVAPRVVTGINVRVPLAGAVSGRVITGAGHTPVANVCVLVVPVNPNGSFGIASTGGDGRYVARHLGAGKYHEYVGDPNCDFFPDLVPPFAPQWYRGQPTEASAQAIHVSASATTGGIGTTIQPFGAVSGSVDTAAHAAVSGECVTAVPFHAQLDPFFGTPAQQELAITGRSGGYTLTALAPGRYKIEFSTGCGSTGFATQWWRNAGSAKSARVITVGFATISGINAIVRR